MLAGLSSTSQLLTGLGKFCGKISKSSLPESESQWSESMSSGLLSSSFSLFLSLPPIQSQEVILTLDLLDIHLDCIISFTFSSNALEYAVSLYPLFFALEVVYSQSPGHT